MKALPCKNCKDPLLVHGKPTAALRNGQPYVVGAAPVPFPHLVHCARCHRKTRVTAADWARLPQMSLAELDRLKLLDPLLKDLQGDGHSKVRATDLLNQGWSPATLDALPKQEPS